MKTNKMMKNSALLLIIFFTTSICFGQFFPRGGYQNGTHGSGGDETFEIFLSEPQHLIAIGGNDEVFLEWEKPFPLGEIKYDDGTVEAWYWLSNPSSNNDMFYVRFNAPISGNITDIAVLNAASANVVWEKIIICPDDGTGKPDLLNPWKSYSSIPVNTHPMEGGEWEILNLTTPQAVDNKDTFYIVTQWSNGSTTGPYVGTDTDSNTGRSAWSMDGGTTWNLWPENFIMRTYITGSKGTTVKLKSENNINAGYLPVVSISTGEKLHFKTNKIALSVQVPKIITSKEFDFKSLSAYKVYRSDTPGGIYSFINSTSGLFYTDNTASNNNEYFYVVTAIYDEGESRYSNEAAAFPQEAALAPYSNSFDINNGNFYGTGDWEWGTPVYINGPSAYSPPNVWGTILDGTYSNFSNSWLIQPFDLSAASFCKVSYAYWNNILSGFDYGYFAVDHDYDNVYDILAFYTGDSGGWQIEELIIHDSLCCAYTRFAFIFQSGYSGLDPGFYIDNFSIESIINLDVKVYLEGPYNGINMDPELNLILPLDQPYNIAPWNYAGTESVTSIPNSNIVDWLLVELRDTTEAQYASSLTKIAQQAAFVLNDGSIVGTDGSSILSFNHSIIHNLFVVIWHRNHLGVISANAVTKTGSVYTYDFTTGSGQAYGGANGHKEIGTGVWGMIGGDGDANKQISNADKNDVWAVQAGTSGYLSGDFTMDIQVNNTDKNDIWAPNSGKGGQVPDGITKGYQCQVPE
ncbi:MAG: hypothetical protein K8R58_01295 [Bacteroidales bacterium]|nr:hypothetical protein [Bacteroidales bacterium]